MTSVPSTEGIPSLGPGSRLVDVIRRNKAGAVGLALILVFAFVTFAAPILMPYSPTARTCSVFEPPSTSHWLGCNDGGIDMLSHPAVREG